MLARMFTFTSVLAIVSVLPGCVSKTAMEPKRAITLRWQRLVDAAGQTCERCGDTQTELQQAARTLRRCLRPLNMNLVLKEAPIDPQTCARDVSESNRIFVDDRPLEDWLGGKVGMSLCGFCCQEMGENVQCRTVTVDDQTYEAIPATLIVRAGLLAAEAALAKQSPKGACCPQAGNASCCPRPRASVSKPSGRP